MIQRVESSLRGAGGLRLHRRAWLPPEPSRSVVLVHGYAEHCGRYEHVAAWLAERGTAVHAYDQRGHGRSDGTRAHVDRFEQYLDDLGRIVDEARAVHPDLPLSILGHSMGGLVTLAFLTERRPQLACVITSGAALSVGPGVSGARRLAARALQLVVPRLSIGSGLDPDGLSRDPTVVRAYLEDPLVFRTMTSSLGAELLSAVPRTAAAASRVDVPVLLLHGDEDRLCLVDGSRAFAAGAPGSEIVTYPGLRHEILNEPEREQVLSDVWRWLEKHAS